MFEAIFYFLNGLLYIKYDNRSQISTDVLVSIKKVMLAQNDTTTWTDIQNYFFSAK